MSRHDLQMSLVTAKCQAFRKVLYIIRPNCMHGTTPRFDCTKDCSFILVKLDVVLCSDIIEDVRGCEMIYPALRLLSVFLVFCVSADS